MSSFYDVTAGAFTLAADLNQFADKMNGTTSAGLIVTGGASTFVPYSGSISAAPGSGDSAIYSALVTADAFNRIALSIRSDGYGMLKAGAGASITANLYAQAGGWKTDQSIAIGSGLTVAGTSNLAGIVATGTSSLDNGAIATDGAGNVAAIKNITSSGNGSFSGSGSFGAGLTVGTTLSAAGGAFNVDSSGNLTAVKTVTAKQLMTNGPNTTYQLGINRDGTSSGTGFNQTSSALFISNNDTSPYRFTFQCNVTSVAHLDNNATNSLVLLHGFQTGGAPDYAEVVYCRDHTLPGGTVICPTDEAVTLGELEEVGDIWGICTHDDCPAAKIISAEPGQVIGTRMRSFTDDLGGRDFEPHADPHWKAIAVAGRVPVQVSEPIIRRMPVVSNGRGGVRSWKPGDHWPLGSIAAYHLDGKGRPLPTDQQLMVLR